MPGKVKTRLIPALGKQGAYSLYCHFLDVMLNRFADNKYADFVIYTTGTPEKNTWFKQYPKVKTQQGNNLGERMYRSMAQELHTSDTDKVILFGADCPFITEEKIRDVIKALDNNELAFIPSLDGGYVLIGASRLERDIFDNISWSTPRVMQQTCQIMDKAGYRYTLLPAVADIDTAADLAYLENTEFYPRKQ